MTLPTNSKPLLLDLFCKEGGGAVGYAQAGFDVVGVDIEPQPRYPFKFIQADAVEFLDKLEPWDAFNAVHASPPCQGYSKAQRLRGNDHERLISATRAAIWATGLPYVIENVEEARNELINPVMLCGSMFGLRLYRHRYFECSFPVTEPLHGQHYLRQVKMGRPAAANEILQPVGNFSGVEDARVAMAMPWASRDGLREAIPPAYSLYIGGRLLEHLAVAEAA